MAHEGSGPMKFGRHFPYQCPAGKLTLGYGRNIQDVGISAEEARDLLDNDINVCLEDLSKFGWFFGMDPVRQRALADMRFQLGPQGFRGFQDMIAALEDGNYADAAVAARASKWARVDSPERAKTVTAMLETGHE
jgi:lysozyme